MEKAEGSRRKTENKQLRDSGLVVFILHLQVVTRTGGWRPHRSRSHCGECNDSNRSRAFTWSALKVAAMPEIIIRQVSG
ncbi:MAG: hypothetical protein FJY56_22100 [Betaproteobacteria bacterium]|nr:hypothetical protein [Betaproteobacteria bacterium]